MADNDHSLIFDNDIRTVTHPDPDREGCNFQSYVDRDWLVSMNGDGLYVFTFHEGGEQQPEGYWNGTYLG